MGAAMREGRGEVNVPARRQRDTACLRLLPHTPQCRLTNTVRVLPVNSSTGQSTRVVVVMPLLSLTYMRLLARHFIASPIVCTSFRRPSATWSALLPSTSLGCATHARYFLSPAVKTVLRVLGGECAGDAAVACIPLPQPPLPSRTS